MKYQHILNKELLFETNDSGEFLTYLRSFDDNNQALWSTFYRLLEESNGYICNMSNQH